IGLGERLAACGLRTVLTWGSAPEREHSERLARRIAGACVAPRLALGDVAALLGGAQAVIGVDTGLTHFAAALDVATVGLYCATDPMATGLYAWARAVNLGGIGRPPALDEVMAALEPL